MSSTSARPVAAVTRGGRGLTFAPALNSVTGHLIARRIRASERAEARPISLVGEIGEAGCEAVTRSGFEPVVQRLFETAGFEVRRSVQDIVPRGLARLGQVGGCDGPPTPQFIDFVHSNFEGTIRYIPHRVDLTRLIAEAANAFPAARIVVVTNSRELGRKIARGLGRWCGRVPAFDCRPNADLQNEELPRVSVSTFLALADLDVEWGIDLLFLLNAAELPGQRADLAINCAHHARVFGFLPIDEHLPPFGEDIARSVLGFAELIVPGHGLEQRQVNLVWSSIRGNAARCATSTVDVLKNLAWHDPIQIRRTTNLALFLQTADRRKIDTRYHEVGAALSHQVDRRLRCLILSDTAQHALRLRHALRGPCFIVGTKDDSDTASITAGRGFRTSASLSAVHLIVTRDALAQGRIDLNAIDAIVVAGASPRKVFIPDRLLASRNADHDALTVFEFEDRRHPLLCRWTRSRKEDYAAHDICAPGADPVRHRVDRFIRSRPLGANV